MYDAIALVYRLYCKCMQSIEKLRRSRTHTFIFHEPKEKVNREQQLNNNMYIKIYVDRFVNKWTLDQPTARYVHVYKRTRARSVLVILGMGNK